VIESETYLREIERYDIEIIEKVEDVFCLSSVIVIKFLKKNQYLRPLATDYQIAIMIAYQTIKACLPDGLQRIEFMFKIKELFVEEFGNTLALRTGINQKKRLMRLEVSNLLKSSDFYKKNGIGKKALLLINATSSLISGSLQARQKLLADIIHMHINRVFSNRMREQEFVIYTLMYQFEVTNQKQTLSFSE